MPRSTATTVKLDGDHRRILDQVAAHMYEQGQIASRNDAMRALISGQANHGWLPVIKATDEVPPDVMRRFWQYGAKAQEIPPWSTPPDLVVETAFGLRRPRGTTTTIKLSRDLERALDQVAAHLYEQGQIASRGDAMRALIAGQANHGWLPAIERTDDVSPDAMRRFWQYGAKAQEIPPWSIIDGSRTAPDVSTDEIHRHSQANDDGTSPSARPDQETPPASRVASRLKRQRMARGTRLRLNAGVARDHILLLSPHQPITAFRAEASDVLQQLDEEEEVALIVRDLGLPDLENRRNNEHSIVRRAEEWRASGVPPEDRLARWYRQAVRSSGMKERQALLQQIKSLPEAAMMTVANQLTNLQHNNADEAEQALTRYFGDSAPPSIE